MRKILLVVASLLLLILPATAEQPDTSRVQELLGIEIAESAPTYKLGRQIRAIDDLIDECYALRATLVALYRETSGREDAYPVTVNISDMTYEELVALRDQIDEQIALLDAQPAASTEPDYNTMSLEDAFASIGAVSANDDCTYRSYEYWDPGYYVIHIDLDTPFSYSSGLSNAIKYTIDFGRRAYPLQEVATLRFVFHQQTVDGKDGTPIIWRITEATFNKMNIDYFYEYTYTASKSFIDACDSAAIYREYKNAAE